MSVRTIQPGRRTGSVTIPSSKSIAHRALIAAALSDVDEPVIRGESKDTQATRACLKAMRSGDPVWPCGESGTTLRLLEPLAGVMGWKGAFRCEGRLGDRPRMPFERKSRYVVPGNVSSQFVSGLLMSLPLADWDSVVAIEGKLQSEAYVKLTEDVLEMSGIRVERCETAGELSWKVPGRQKYAFRGGYEVEGDWSQAAFFLAMDVEVKGVDAASHQGDRAVVDFLARIRAGEKTIDISQTPDLYPALAAFAASIGSSVVFTGTERLRLKESDRIASTAALIESVRAGEVVKTCNDHRIAMSAAVMACYSDKPVTIDDDACVAKSYPGFWTDFESLERIES